MSLYGAALAMTGAVGVWLIVAGVVGGPERPRRAVSLSIDARRHAASAASGLVVFVAGWALTGWPAAGASLAGVAVMGPLFVEAHRQRRVAMERTEALASWAEMLRDTIASHAGLHQAIATTAPVAPAALRSDVRRLAARSSQMPLGRALALFAAEVADPVADLIVAAITIADRHQAQSLPELLGGVAASTRQYAAMRLRVETGRARTYASARAMVVVTLLMVVVLMVFSPAFMKPYDSWPGQIVLLVAGGLFVGAVWALIQMSRPVLVPRVLAGIEDVAGEAAS